MDFSRLRLSGFKSFVDPAEFRIEPGLTGVVGPNGCGKSNLLEALRWVMGAASAKAMRGEGMDDVIFAGSSSRPSRNHAEVVLTIDNAEADAPAPFRSDPTLEVTRRIDRGEGSTYRVNGREVRARDVQILFADASTGANSPALVRQGQISELIAAKPQNRRRILEEAAGVTGLHGRRHEAELRVAAAATNLERLDDLARELESNLAKLRREARQAERYKALAAEIRTLHATLLQRRWIEAREAAARAASQAAEAHAELEAMALAVAAATTAALNAEGAIRPLRDEDAAASAVLGRLAIEKDRLDRDLELAQTEARRHAAELERLSEDDALEAGRVADAATAGVRLEAEISALGAQIDETPKRTSMLEAVAMAAEAARTEAEQEVEGLATRVAAAAAEARVAGGRLAEAETRLGRAQTALAKTLEDLSALASGPDPDEAERQGTWERAQASLAEARKALEAAEAARAAARGQEAFAHRDARTAEDELASAMAEAQALARLARGPADRTFAPAIDGVAVPEGLEAAVAAALGDDLEAALDPRAPTFWAGARVASPKWPKAATPLADLVEAPDALAPLFAFTALVDSADGPTLQPALLPGARLVSRDGDLWRWDGYTAKAAAPRPAQARLEQRARLATLEAAMAKLRPVADQARGAHRLATGTVETAEANLRAARTAALAAETVTTQARESLEVSQQDLARRETRAGLLAEARQRLQVELGEAEAAVAARTDELAERGIDDGLVERLRSARVTAAAARESASRARLALDAELRERDGRAHRLSEVTAEAEDWRRRREASQRRREALAEARALTSAALTRAQEAPAQSAERLARLLDELAEGEARKARTVDALSVAEAERVAADRQARAAESHAADAREVRATLDARLDAARDRLTDQTRLLAEASGVAAEEVERRFGSYAVADEVVGEPGEVRVARLERERDSMGPVNLRAEEEAKEQAARVAELASERADLAGALGKFRQAVGELNAEGRSRLLAAFDIIHGHFRDLFVTLFQGGQAELRLIESDDPLEAGLEIFACPPGKRMAVMSLMSGGEQALTAMALIFAVFLANPAPVCVLDEADAPLDDANVDRFCNLLAAMRARASTRFIVITHNALTMSRMDRLYGVTMREAGVSQLVSVDLREAEAMAAQ